MNLFQLEYFITLAETLSYTRASQKLHITQPTLSKLIINLEHSIGSQLFIRNKRDVKLTATGKLFYDEIKKTLNTYEAAVRKVKDMENGTTGIINVGILGTALNHFFPQIINRFQELHPTIRVNPLDYTYSQLMETFSNGQIDLALLPDFGIGKHKDMVKKIIFSDAMCIVVHKNHRLSETKSVSLKMIKDEPLISMDARISLTDHNIINNIYAKEGYLPNTIYEASSLLNMMLMADCRMGITLLAAHMKKFANETLRFIPLEGFETHFRVACIYHKETTECIDKFIKAIDTYSRP